MLKPIKIIQNRKNKYKQIFGLLVIAEIIVKVRNSISISISNYKNDIDAQHC